MTESTSNPASEVPNPAAAFAELNRMLFAGAAGKLDAGKTMPDMTQMMQLLASGMAQDSERWLELNNRYYREHLALWQACANPSTDGAAALPPPTDRRFRAPEWREPYYNYLAQSYLLSARWLEEMTAAAKLEAHPKHKLEFYTRQMIDALSPANYPWTNPEAIKLAAETEGESLSRGLKNLAADIDKGLVSMTDETAFEVGRNLAITPGAVVYENDFMQLIQYAQLTEQVN
jgi:polyhydroxyalkanoate synthase